MAIPQPKLRYDDSGDGGSGFQMRHLRFWPLTYWLIAINAVVFFIQMACNGTVTEWGEFAPIKIVHGLQFWRFLSFQFLHGSIWHLLFNMLALYYFGVIVESRLGRRRYLAFYLICGICGALFYLLLWRLDFLSASAGEAMLGASAGIFGVLIGVVHVAPHMAIRMLFPPIILRIRTLALIFIGIAALTILAKGQNAGGEAAHIGGALAGWVLIKNVDLLNLFDRKRKQRRFWRPGDPASNFFREDLG
jgi:membrane associated rhomboid family serine protease